ncbi:platelet binding protein GspB [Stomoxys calcitrans]|uniref:platelet binding protein GspB n=1 Tax=Stomoxys calcitrans TaxID=35570 RepID=UPI0027E2D730|nr:platelet binding protein GspB [Stomoxys calcitrans]XP_013115726.2 platelet binding protein GspB [Stomoxys calcitrans]XP_013115727.2 platelet binding protein GspB [Stomoxys calcitrans]
MFNFHKPRTYRSAEGCCICRAKSSSSRFTDSRKYERDTMQCFDLKYPRQGEICNACVLLVKRYKRLPVGSKRNWSHVVDARAGPGSSKIQTKYKGERTSSRSHSTSNSATTCPPSSSSCISNTSACSSPNIIANGHPMSFLPEKFSKIFKKSKKIKESSSTSSLSSNSSTSSSSAKRKSSNNGWSHTGNGVNLNSLPTTPDSLDSDYEDSRINGSSSLGTVVHFQTQTRASAFRAQAAAEARKRVLKLGSKRRKLLKPRKNRRLTSHEESVQFYDDEEWREKKSCCGLFYECPTLSGAILLDVANYKPCDKHISLKCPRAAEESTGNDAKENMSANAATPKPLLHSIPVVVQLQPSAQTSSMMHSASSPCVSAVTNVPMSTPPPTALTITKSTPVLKKHHLFFKRQSESFPQGDMVTTSTSTATSNYYSSNNSVSNTKTESDYNNHHHSAAEQQQQQHHTLAQQYPNLQSTTNIFQRRNEHANTSTASSNGSSITSSVATALSISVSTVAASMPTSASPSPLFTSMPQMPKHSLAKVTTISPPHTAATMPPQNKSGFLHKIKADTGKIVKHSLDKFNTAVRLKTSDLNDMKPIIKTIDKSLIAAKPPTMANIQSLNVTPATTATPYHTLSSYNSVAQPTLTTASLSAASPTSSTSSTKFSDNSSDSGFDENMLLDRKSASPLQEDCEKKLLSRHGVQTMFLASGVQIQGQPQNLVLTGNEVAAKILQNRKYSSIPPISPVPVSSNARILATNHPTTTAVKIAQISTGNGGGIGALPLTSTSLSHSSSVMSSAAAQAKMRAIYNNSNTIQHENGITTIVPASSLAASTQLAAMQNINIAPSTVTITPAPTTTQFNGQNIISRKLTAASIINLQSNNPSNTTQHLSNSGNNLSSSTATNQKIILLKTSPTNSHAISTSSTAGGSKFSTTASGGGAR